MLQSKKRKSKFKRNRGRERERNENENHKRKERRNTPWAHFTHYTKYQSADKYTNLPVSIY